MPWREGRTGAYVYDPGPEAVIKDAFASDLNERGLDPTVFPSALRMESEVVAMAAHPLTASAGSWATSPAALPRASCSR